MNQSTSSPEELIYLRARDIPEPGNLKQVDRFKRNYAWKSVDNVAFWIQRETGIALFGYLVIHVHTIHDLQNPQTFDAALKTFSQPLFKLGEIASLATAILHALNGIRLTM